MTRRKPVLLLTALLTLAAAALSARPPVPTACFFAGGTCKTCPDKVTAQPCRTLLCEGKRYTTCGTCQTGCVPPTS